VPPPPHPDARALTHAHTHARCPRSPGHQVLVQQARFLHLAGHQQQALSQRTDTDIHTHTHMHGHGQSDRAIGTHSHMHLGYGGHAVATRTWKKRCMPRSRACGTVGDRLRPACAPAHPIPSATHTNTQVSTHVYTHLRRHPDPDTSASMDTHRHLDKHHSQSYTPAHTRRADQRECARGNEGSGAVESACAAAHIGRARWSNDN
jgi:hypothetical protein